MTGRERWRIQAVILAAQKDTYIDALEAADAGNFLGFANYLGRLSLQCSSAACLRAEAILAGRNNYRHSNGVYYRPTSGNMDGDVVMADANLNVDETKV